MSIIDKLNDEERALLAFVKQHLRAQGMSNALIFLDDSESLSDVREIIDYYRQIDR